MEEREKYESWLEDLEAKKDSTPPKVFDRVRQDYLARLQTVMEQLSEHTELLEEHLDTLSTKLRELEMAEESITEQQDEAALRKKVGEITAAEWESSSKKAQKELAKNRENQESVAADIDRIRSLLGSEAAEEEEEEEAPPPKAKGKGKGKDFNELEFLTSVVGSAPAAPPPERKSGEAARKSGEAERKSGEAPKTPTPPAAAPAQAAAPAPPVAAPTTPSSQPAQAPIATQRKSGAALSVSQEAEDAEQPKTLKCAECGAMNLPSEWYCERCGAELTVV